MLRCGGGARRGASEQRKTAAESRQVIKRLNLVDTAYKYGHCMHERMSERMHSITYYQDTEMQQKFEERGKREAGL